MSTSGGAVIFSWGFRFIKRPEKGREANLFVSGEPSQQRTFRASAVQYILESEEQDYSPYYEKPEEESKKGDSGSKGEIEKVPKKRAAKDIHRV